MSDLISRKKIRDYIKGEINPYGKPFEGTAYELGLKIMRYVDAMDSDYDIDKVVEELKMNKQNALEVEESIKEYNVWNEAIEIVKQGGVSDDVCEWKYKDTEYYWESSCEHLHIFMADGPKENEYDFCPYCGKKIKVVE